MTAVGDYMAAVPAMPNGNSPWAARYAWELRDILVRDASRRPRTLQVHLGPSELGAECDRQVVGKMAQQPHTNNVSSPWPSVVGTAVHAYFAEMFHRENLRSGVLRWIPEVRVAPTPAHPGTADLYDAANNCVVDHKVLGETSMAKIRSAAGPPRNYVVQLLLYAMGYRNMGLPVDRVVLAAWPRTAPTLSQMYAWERVHTAEDDVLISQVLAETAFRTAIARRVMAGEVRIEDVPITPGDDTCYFCFAGETEVVTRDGIRPLRELAGTEPELLVPRTGKNPGLQAKGNFVRAPVRELGRQQLWKITLGSRRAEKIVYATAEHRWMLTPPPRPRTPVCDWPERTTAQLLPGDRLRSLRAAFPGRAELMPWAVAQGFVFGDGTTGQDNRPAALCIYDNGKDEALLPFFPCSEPVPYEGVKHIYGLPRFWKDVPPIRESRTFLLSWLAGYFAADGTVGERGQCTLYSADERAIRFARDAAAVCGVGYSPVRHRTRTDIPLPQGRLADGPLWSLGLRRRDLPEWFFLIKEHAIRAAAANEEEARGTYWTVKSVQVTDRIEQVYCATVPGAGMFGLADDLLTGNCPFFRPESARDGGPGCAGHSLPY